MTNEENTVPKLNVDWQVIIEKSYKTWMENVSFYNIWVLCYIRLHSEFWLLAMNAMNRMVRG